MKITQKDLKKIIQEEIKKIIEQESVEDLSGTDPMAVEEVERQKQEQIRIASEDIKQVVAQIQNKTSEKANIDKEIKILNTKKASLERRLQDMSKG